MKTLSFGLAALVGCLLLASVKSELKYGDQDYLEKEKNLLVALKYVYQPQWNGPLYTLGKDYKISDDISNYNDAEAVTAFVKMCDEKKLRGKRETFSTFNPEQLEEAETLLKVLLSAKNFETLKKVIAFARVNVNEKVFIYVLDSVVAHSENVHTLIMPPPYEASPYQYFPSEAIKYAQDQARQDFPGIEKVDGYKTLIVDVNYTAIPTLNDERKVSYLTEDVEWNAFYYNFNIDYPQFMEGQKSGLNKDRRGELFISVHQQMLARYYLERLSNGLGKIPELNFRQPVETGYNPSLLVFTDKQYPSRPNHANLENAEELANRESQISAAVDGLTKPEDVNNLGNIIQGNPEAANGANQAIPKSLETNENAARDPLFYQFYKNLLQSFYKLMSKVQPYTAEEIGFAGVKINSVQVDKLETFFENKDIDITNIIEVPTSASENGQAAELNFKPDDYFVKARTVRLNNKPFSYKINVQSDKAQDASVRVFIGAKQADNKNVINFNENRQNFVLLDIFKQSLAAGENVIARDSSQINHYQADYTTYFDLYKRLLSAKSGEREWSNDLLQGRCRLPKNLMLPKGSKEGVEYTFYVIVTPFQGAATSFGSTHDPKISCGVGSGSRFMEDRSLLFPVDREIKSTDFFAANMYFEDVKIFFNDANGIHYV